MTSFGFRISKFNIGVLIINRRKESNVIIRVDKKVKNWGSWVKISILRLKCYMYNKSNSSNLI